MGNTIERVLPSLIALFGVYWLLNSFIEKSQKAIEPVTKPIGSALAEIQFMFNGSNYITRAWAGFFLEPSKFDYTLKVIDLEWVYAITKLNDGNESLFNEILDSDLRLKDMYRPLLGSIVDDETIATIRKS